MYENIDSLIFRLILFSKNGISDLGTLEHSKFPILKEAYAKFQVYTMTISFIKMMISKSYTEYIQKRLPWNSLDYINRVFNFTPADNSVQS